jgi:hypothetical protein
MKFYRFAAIAGTAAALVAFTAGSASASTHHHHGHHPHTWTAVTHLSHRDDSGGNGNWAIDTYTRTAKVTLRGSAPLSDCGVSVGKCYAFTASLSDHGDFRATPGAYTPNQGTPFTGDTIKGSPHGDFWGYGLFGTFYATTLPDSHLVPRHVSGDTPSSSQWPALFFPSAPTGISENDWGYFYHTGHQRWADASFNSAGQVPSAGNIS